MTNTSQVNTAEKVKRRSGLLARFKRDRKGSVAIEFVMLAMPFSLLLFAVIESGISFGAQQVMSNAVDTIARQIRVETLKASDVTPASLRQKICDKMKFFVSNNCPGLEVDLKPYNSYADVPKTIPRLGNKDINTAGFAATVGAASQIQHLRIFYRWPYVTDFIGNKLAELPDNKTLLYASQTWKNEAWLSN